MVAVQTALVVDDSHSARYVLQRLLEHRNIQVHLAETAQQAIAYLQEHKPDVVFMDDMMPGMDGREAIAQLASDPGTAAIPIVMYTGRDPSESAEQARTHGIVGVLTKPFTDTDVGALLEKLAAIAPGAARPVQPIDVPRLRRIDGPEGSPAGSMEPDGLRDELALLIKRETRHAVEQLLGEALEDQLALQLRAHKSSIRQSLDELRADQQRFQTQVLEHRLQRLVGILEQRLERRADLIQKTLTDRQTNGGLGPRQRTQVASVVRSETAKAAQRPARETARQVTTEIMSTYVEALQARVGRLGRRMNAVIASAFVFAIAATAFGYWLGAQGLQFAN